MTKILHVVLVVASLASAGFYDTLQIGKWIPAEPLQNPPLRAACMGFEKCDFADALNGFIFQGGFCQLGSEPQNALWLFSSSENRWRILDAGYAKSVKNEYMLNSGHDRATMYDSKLHAIFQIRASAMGGAQTGYLQYDVRGNTGRCYWANPSSIREGGSGASCFDTDSNCIYYITDNVNRLHRYRVSENTWKRLANPPAIGTTMELGFNIVYDRVNKKVVLFTANGNVFAYTPSTNTWETVSTTSHVSTDFPHVIWNDVTKKIIVYDKGAKKTWSYDLTSNVWTELCLTSTYDVGPFVYGLTFNPNDNVYTILSPYGGGGNYSAQLYIMRDTARSFRSPPVFTKKSYSDDPNWKSIGGGLRNDSLGYAHFPTIVMHRDTLYAAIQESKANWQNTGGFGTYIKKWDGSSWKNVGSVAGYGQSASLFSDGNTLYFGCDGYSMWHGNRSFVFKAGNDRLDSVGGQIFWDYKSLPYLIRYRNALHAIHMGKGTMSEMDVLYRSVFDSASNTWTQVDSITHGYNPDNEWSLPVNVPVPMRFPFSAVVKNDSIFVATTDMFARGGTFDTLPIIANVRCFNGTSWSTLPPVNADRKTVVGTHPSLAVSPDNKDLYIAYLKRPYIGRKNNELFVEKWNGTSWQPMGGTLNVHGQTEDAWSYRPSVAVNSYGVPYVAWNEHVWGSCAQVFVKHWNGTEWVSDFASGSSLNNDGQDGGAQSVTITFKNDTPIVAWSEYSFGKEFFRKVVVKKLTGASTIAAKKNREEMAQEISVSPNPFNPTVFISLSKAFTSGTSLKIYDLSGKLISVLTINNSNGTASWNAAKYPSGIYILLAQKGAVQLSRKIIYNR